MVVELEVEVLVYFDVVEEFVGESGEPSGGVAAGVPVAVEDSWLVESAVVGGSIPDAVELPVVIVFDVTEVIDEEVEDEEAKDEEAEDEETEDEEAEDEEVKFSVLVVAVVTTTVEVVGADVVVEPAEGGVSSSEPVCVESCEPRWWSLRSFVPGENMTRNLKKFKQRFPE